MIEFTPKENEKCLMAIGSDKNPPSDSDYYIGCVVEYTGEKILWINELGRRNTFTLRLCRFKPLTAYHCAHGQIARFHTLHQLS